MDQQQTPQDAAGSSDPHHREDPLPYFPDAPPPPDPGWYPTESDPGIINYWDGQAWIACMRWDGAAWVDFVPSTGSKAAKSASELKHIGNAFAKGGIVGVVRSKSKQEPASEVMGTSENRQPSTAEPPAKVTGHAPGLSDLTESNEAFDGGEPDSEDDQSAPNGSTGGLNDRLPARIEAELAKHLGHSEIVLCKLRGAFKEALICTSTRVIIIKGGYMTGQLFGNDTFQQPYANISSVQVKFHLATGYLEVNAGGIQNAPRSYWAVVTSTKSKASPAHALNCVSLSSRKQSERFRQAAALIMAKVEETHRGTPSLEVSTPNEDSGAEAVTLLERLGKLRDSGVLTEEEFLTKKAEVLKRL